MRICRWLLNLRWNIRIVEIVFQDKEYYLSVAINKLLIYIKNELFEFFE